MAGNAQANLSVNPYLLRGIDTTTRSTVVEGTLLPIVSGGVKTVFAITAYAVATNVLTLTAANNLTAGGGQIIIVSGFTGGNAFVNGTYTTTSATSTTIVAALTHADASATAAGVATLQPTYTTGGININYAFVDLSGNPSPIGTIGPNVTAKWIEFQTVAGSAYNYKVDQSAVPNKLLIFNGITQATDAAAIPSDTVAFRAEFVKNQF